MEVDKYVKIYRRLQEHLKEALTSNSNIYDWFMIAVNGSYNYNMDTPQSDIDSKLLVIPSLEQLVFKKELNYVHHMSDNDEHVEVKDIRHYFATMLKQNINYVETLYAQVYIINPKYDKYFDYIYQMRDVISSCNPIATIKCVQGTAHQKYEQMLKMSPAREQDIVKLGYDKKSLHHLARCALFGSRFMKGTPYKECLRNDEIPHNRDYIKYLKTPRNTCSKEQAIENAKLSLEILDQETENYLAAIESCKKDFAILAAQIKDILNEIAFQMIKQSITKECHG